MDLETLLKLAGVQQSQSDCGCGDSPCGCSDTPEPTGMSKFIAMVSPELLGQQPAMEADDEWGNAPDGAAGPAEYEDGISNLGSTSDTSLRRYLKARGANVTVDEEVYPDLTVESVTESYAAYTAEKAKNPYAIGMAAAMKSAGDKPPLKKSTITKAHKIAKGIDEAEDPQEATPGTYARVIYDYSEDFGMITLYDNGNKIDEWSGYFGADTVGNPLADEFVKIAKKNGLNPEGMNIVDDEGEKGTFKDNTFNWDQFANDATGTNEAEQSVNEAGGIGGGMSGTKFSKAADYAPAVAAGVRGAVDNFTMGGGEYARAAADYGIKNLGARLGMSEPTTFDRELEQELEKDVAAQRDYPVAYDIGDKAATIAQLASGVGAGKALAGMALKSGANTARQQAWKAALNAGEAEAAALQKAAASQLSRKTNADGFELGMHNALDLTPQMRVPASPLKLTPQMRVTSKESVTESINILKTLAGIK